MPPKVSRTSTSRTTPPKKTSVSSSKSSGSSKTSSSSSAKKSTITSAPKPRNVDKVDFGKPKPTASAGTYKPAPPKATIDHAEELRQRAIADAQRVRTEARAAARAQLPGLVDKANKAYQNLQDALESERRYKHDLEREIKIGEQQNFFGDLKQLWEGATKGGAAGSLIASQVQTGNPLVDGAIDFAPEVGFAGGAFLGLAEAANQCRNGPAIDAAQNNLAEAHQAVIACQKAFDKADNALQTVLTEACMPQAAPKSFDYPTNAAVLIRINGL